MRKFGVLCLVAAVLLMGCSYPRTGDEESMKTYESYIDTVISNQGIESTMIPFDYDFHVYKMEDDTYEYEIAIFDPSVAMYNITAIAVNPELDSNTNVHPCLGILGADAQESFHMVPYQSNPQKGFYRGFVLEGISTESQFTLQVMVCWKDSALLKEQRVFFNVHFALEADDTAVGEKETRVRSEE